MRENDDQGSTDDRRPHVHVVGTGGTIANVTGEYGTPEAFLRTEQLVEKVPELTDVARVTTTDVSRQGSSALTPDVWFDIAREVTRQVGGPDPPDGFVVTHGSNTAEETAYFLNLALTTDRPVVVTAAMLGLSELGSDAFKNLYDAVRVASTPEAADRGTLLVVNDTIHHARDVTKLASAAPDSWESPNFGPVGNASPGRPVTFYRSVDRKCASDTVFDATELTPEAFPLQDVHVVFSSMAAGDTLTRAALAADPAGIVVAGFPTGHGAKSSGVPSQSEALHDAATQEVPVVMCTRGVRGRIDPSRVADYPTAYGVAGDTLRPQKARVLLALGVTETDDPGTLQEYFTTY